MSSLSVERLFCPAGYQHCRRARRLSAHRPEPAARRRGAHRVRRRQQRRQSRGRVSPDRHLSAGLSNSRQSALLLSQG